MCKTMKTHKSIRETNLNYNYSNYPILLAPSGRRKQGRGLFPPFQPRCLASHGATWPCAQAYGLWLISMVKFLLHHVVQNPGPGATMSSAGWSALPAPSIRVQARTRGTPPCSSHPLTTLCGSPGKFPLQLFCRPSSPAFVHDPFSFLLCPPPPGLLVRNAHGQWQRCCACPQGDPGSLSALASHAAGWAGRGPC